MSSTDLLIAAAAYERVLLLNNDENFEVIAAHVRIEEERVSRKIVSDIGPLTDSTFPALLLAAIPSRGYDYALRIQFRRIQIQLFHRNYSCIFEMFLQIIDRFPALGRVIVVRVLGYRFVNKGSLLLFSFHLPYLAVKLINQSTHMFLYRVKFSILFESF